MEKTACYSSALLDPIGEVWASVSERGLAAIEFGGGWPEFERSLRRLGFTTLVHQAERAAPALTQIGEYLAGQRQVFDLPIDWSLHTPFQRQALQATLAVPYGQTVTYGELAIRLGKPRAARAVGRAEATNPLPLVIPCHRVLGSDGKLHGYGAGAGLPTKAWLLRHEQGTASR
jgi:methylated-DNA-[protein]-cysteine S-methyltransferase